MRSLYSAVVLGVVALAAGGCSRTREAQSPTVVIVPDSMVRPSTGRQQALAPVARGTIRLGEVETAGSLPEAPAPAAEGAAPTPPSGVGGGPPAAQTSVGAMSPTTVTGADSPLDSATTAGPAAGQPGNPVMTGSATAPAGPNSHGGTTGKSGGR